MGKGGLPRKGLLPKTGRLKRKIVERGDIEDPGVNQQRDRALCSRWASIVSVSEIGGRYSRSLAQSAEDTESRIRFVKLPNS